MKGFGFFFLVVLVLFCLPVKADKELAEIQNVVWQYPGVRYFPSDRSDAAKFWAFIVERNRGLNVNMSRNKKLQERIRYGIKSDMGKMRPIFNRMRDMYDEEVFQGIRRFMCGSGKGVRRILEEEADEPNAGMYPDGTMLVTTALVELMDEKELIGVFAHELAHMYLRHTEVGELVASRRERVNEAFVGVTAGLKLGADVLAAMNGAEVDAEQTEEYLENMMRIAWDDVERFYCRHSRVQELEADIVACYFLEWIGVGKEHYINALNKLLDCDGGGYDAYSNHPDTEFRIDILTILNFDLEMNVDYVLSFTKGRLTEDAQEVLKRVVVNQGVRLGDIDFGGMSKNAVGDAARELFMDDVIEVFGTGDEMRCYLNPNLFKGKKEKKRRKDWVNEPLYY